MTDGTADIAKEFAGGENETVAQGLRLVKAFMRIDDPASRAALIGSAEAMAGPASPPEQQSKT